MSINADAIRIADARTRLSAEDAIPDAAPESMTTTDRLALERTALEQRFGESFAAPGSAFLVASGGTVVDEAAAARLELRQSSLATPEGRRAAVVEQLRVEARINEPVNADYAADLRTLANEIADGERTLPPGSYLSREIADPLLATDLLNSVPVQPLSSSTEQVVERVAEIEAEIAEIVRFTPGDAARGGLGGVLGAASDLDRVVDLQFEKNSLINAHRMQPSSGENGNVYRALGVEADAERPPVIFVNGINTDANRASLQALELSDVFESPVDHVVNVSDVVSAGAGGRDSLIAENGNVEASEVRIQQHLLGNRPAAIETANLILDQLFDPALGAANAPVKIVGYSQGSAIASQALRDVDSHLQSRVDGGTLSADDKAVLLERVRFLGIGPSVDERVIDRAYTADGDVVAIEGLSDIDYRVILDANDPITLMNGVGQESVDPATTANQARRILFDPDALLPHLSYFEQYENTDPGSDYNPATALELKAWSDGIAVNGIADITR